MKDQLLHLTKLPAAGVLAGLEKDEIERLSSYGRQWKVTAGERVIGQGEPQDCLYVVLSGRLLVSRSDSEGSDGEFVLGDLRKGDSFGEMNILDRQIASATVFSTDTSSIWRMTRGDFERFLERHPKSAVKLLHALSGVVVRRLRTTMDHVAKNGESEPANGWW